MAQSQEMYKKKKKKKFTLTQQKAYAENLSLWFVRSTYVESFIIPTPFN